MTSPDTQVQYHEVQQPIEDDQTAAAIAAILLSGVAVYLQIKALEKLLAPLGVSAQAAMLAYSVTAGRVTAPLTRREIKQISVTPNNKPAAVGLQASTDVMKAARTQEVYYRASYIANAATRIEHELAVQDKTVRAVLADESLNYRRHSSARRNRLDKAASVSRDSQMYGPLLGWYLNPLLNNEAECIAANGHNFHAAEGTLIGLPGAVHPNCGCKSGPPHDGGEGNMVNDHVREAVRIAPTRLYRVKKAS